MKQQGFTLIELLVVCVLLAIMLAVSVPAIHDNLFSDPLRKAARKITGAIREVRFEAETSVDGCILELDLSESRFGYYCTESDKSEQQTASEEKPDTLIALPEGIRFESVWSGQKQNVTSGKVTLWVSTKGMMEQTIINIGDGDRKMALVTSVFRPEISIKDKALSFEDLDIQ